MTDFKAQIMTAVTFPEFTMLGLKVMWSGKWIDLSHMIY